MKSFGVDWLITVRKGIRVTGSSVGVGTRGAGGNAESGDVADTDVAEGVEKKDEDFKHSWLLKWMPWHGLIILLAINKQIFARSSSLEG